jgi:chorismate mutase
MNMESAAPETNIGYRWLMAALPEEIVLSRRTIDELDHSIVELLARRRAIVKELFAKKRALGLPFVDPVREAELIAERSAYGRELGIPHEFVEAIFRKILEDSHTLDVASDASSK